ncbi:MAG: hypothetical protein QNL24_08550, partial [Akkermansiaceae bacterium]
MAKKVAKKKTAKSAPAEKVGKKVPSKRVVKKAVSKKAAPVKKASPKKAASKKAAPVKKASPKKAASKKAAPVKKTSSKKAASKKAAPVKKASPKKAASKKAAPVKKAPPKKAARKAVARKKAEEEVIPPPVVKRAYVRPETLAKLTIFQKKQQKKLMDLRDQIMDMMYGMQQDTIKTLAEVSEAYGSGMHQADAGTDSYDRDFALNVLSKEANALDEIKEALQRLELGTYGICESSGAKIPQARLEAIPFA